MLNNGTRTEDRSYFLPILSVWLVAIITVFVWAACSENPAEPVYEDNTTHVELPMVPDVPEEDVEIQPGDIPPNRPGGGDKLDTLGDTVSKPMAD